MFSLNISKFWIVLINIFSEVLPHPYTEALVPALLFGTGITAASSQRLPTVPERAVASLFSWAYLWNNHWAKNCQQVAFSHLVTRICVPHSLFLSFQGRAEMAEGGFDPCECVCSHEYAMRRLLNLVRHETQVFELGKLVFSHCILILPFKVEIWLHKLWENTLGETKWWVH